MGKHLVHSIGQVYISLSKVVNTSYDPVDIDKAGCMKVCWQHARHCMLAVQLNWAYCKNACTKLWR